MKKLNDATFERYEFHSIYGDYIVEVEETEDPRAVVASKMWDFWLYKKGMCIKTYIVGIIANQMQANEPRIYTKEEALEMATYDIADQIEAYRNEYETD